jgi:hypothetical protein
MIRVIVNSDLFDYDIILSEKKALLFSKIVMKDYLNKMTSKSFLKVEFKKVKP